MLCVFGVLTKYDVHLHTPLWLWLCSASRFYSVLFSQVPNNVSAIVYVEEVASKIYNTRTESKPHVLHDVYRYFFSISIALISIAQFSMLNSLNVRFLFDLLQSHVLQEFN